MDYNWTEIFKEKSTKELYEIYCGQSFLPLSAVLFAKKELEARNFDFKGFDTIIFEQQYEVLVEEASNIIKFLSDNQKRSVKESILTIIILGVPISLYLGYNGFHLIYIIFILVFSIFGMLLDSVIMNYFLKKKNNRLEMINKEIQFLVSQQNQLNNNLENKLSIIDFNDRVYTKVIDSFKLIRNIAFIAAIIFIGILLIKFFIK